MAQTKLNPLATALQSFQNHAPQLAAGVYVHHSASVIGHVNLGDNVSVWPCAVIRGDINFIRIGAGSNIQDGAVLHVNHASEYDKLGSPLIIGDHVTIGHNVILHGCTVGNKCLIGMGSILMDGVQIGDQSIIGAGSLVTEGKIFPPRSLIVGRPAKFVRVLTETEILFLDQSADNYLLYQTWYK